MSTPETAPDHTSTPDDVFAHGIARPAADREAGPDAGADRPQSGQPPGARGYAMVLLACILFGITGTLSRKLIDQGVTAVTLTEFRMAFGFLGLVTVLAVTRRQLLRVAARQLPQLVAFGISLALVIYFYFQAIGRLPIAVALVLQFSAAAWMVIGQAVARRRRPSLDTVVALVLTLGGMVATAGFHGDDLAGLDPEGLAYGVATTVAYIAYLLLGRYVGRTVAAPTSTTYGALVAAIFWCVAQPPWQIAATAWQPGHLGALVLIGVLGMAVPFALILGSLRIIGPSRVSMVNTFEIVSTSLFAWIFIGQALAWPQIVGCLCVITGIAVCSRGPRAAVAPDGPSQKK